MNRILLIILVLLVFYSCSTTKSLPEGEVLYTGSTIKIKKQSISENEDWEIENYSDKISDVYLNLWDPPNGSLFGLPWLMVLPTKLWIYNIFYTEGNSGYSQWMRKNFGERPITISEIAPELKTMKAVNVYENYGHFGTSGDYELKFNKKENKARITYHLKIAPSYHYRNILYEDDPSKNEINQTFQQYQPNSFLNSGDEFNLDILKMERTNMWEYLQNNGYFFLREDEIILEADSTIGDRQLDLKSSLSDNLNTYATFPQYIYQFDIHIGDSADFNLTEKYYDWNSGKIRKRFIDRLLPLNEGSPYSMQTSTLTRRNISELGIFSNANLQYEIVPGDTSRLNAVLKMEPLDASSIEFNLKGNYENIGYIGPSLGMNFTQLNVFNGAENLTINADAYYNFPMGAYRERLSPSSGFSVRSGLTFPWLGSRFKFIKSEYALPKQIVSFNTDFNNRKDYFQLYSWSVGYGINWKSSPKVSHQLQLVNATYSNIYNTTALFDTLVAENPSLRESLIKQFILGSSYTFTFDGRNNVPRNLNMYFEGSLEFAGNALNLFNSVFGNAPAGTRTFLGINYSQFTRLKYDFRLFYNLGENNQLAFRHIGGVGFAYGNSSQMPYIREFFTGGTNSLRPISARTIGPGRYLEFTPNEVNQVGNLKLEWNLEYRFKLFWKLNGALWSDMGNIWLLEEDPLRPGGKIRWGHIFEDSYLTAGLGARLNLNFVLIRFDYGAVMYIPIFDEGYRWIWQNKGNFYYPVISFGLPF